MRARFGLPAAIAGIAAGVVAGAVLWLGGSKDSERPPQILATHATGAGTPTSEPPPEETDLGSVDAIVLEWLRWSSTAGAWSSQMLRGGVENPPDPLPFGYGTSPIVSPDGRLVAHVDRATGDVTVYDLAKWEPVLTAPTAPDVFLHTWSEDSSQVYGWREYCGQPADRGICLTDWERDLWRIDLQDGTAKRVFVFDFTVMALEIDPHAQRAYALGVDSDICCAIDPVGDPFLAVMDLGSGEATRVSLPGLLAGQLNYGLEDGTGASFYPATVLAPDGSKLYIVDAAEDAVLVADLATSQIERFEVREKRSALSRFGDWLTSQLVSDAEAKGGPSFHRDAAITPDGRYLIIGGTAPEEATASDGSMTRENRPSGVMAVDTQTMEIVLRDEVAPWFRLSPDGRRLLTFGSYYDESLGEDEHGGGLVAFGLSVFDLETLEQVDQRWQDEAVEPIVFSPDGQFVYVRSEGPGMEEAKRLGVGCNRDCFVTNLLDLDTREVVWSGMLPEQQSVLAFPQSP